MVSVCPAQSVSVLLSLNSCPWYRDLLVAECGKDGGGGNGHCWSDCPSMSEVHWDGGVNVLVFPMCEC